MQDVPIRKTDAEKSWAGHRYAYQFVTIALFLLPATVLFITFVMYPVIQAAYTSFFKWNGLGPLDDFIGLGNYDRMFKVSDFFEALAESGSLGEALKAMTGNNPFLKAITHNGVIIALSLGIQLPLSLGLALLVGRKLPGRVVFRTIFFLPFVISQAITAYLWTFMFNPRFVMITTINNIIHSIIPSFEPGSWLGDTDRVLVAIFIIMTWQFFGFHMVLYIAGLQQIPDEVEEAAIIDGATRLQNLRYIVIPMLSSTVITSVYLSVLGSLQQFTLVWIMTEGGPANASEVMATYMYRHGFVSFRLGFGAAVAVVLFLICLTFSLVYQRLVMRREYAGGVS
jgi:raffinose/stachyose/melibiose transport system permease protein